MQLSGGVLFAVANRFILGGYRCKIREFAAYINKGVIVQAIKRIDAIVHHAGAAKFAAAFLKRGVFGILLAAAHKPRAIGFIAVSVIAHFSTPFLVFDPLAHKPHKGRFGNFDTAFRHDYREA